MSSTQEEREFERKMLDAIDEVIKGTEWAPPEGGILIDAVVVLMYMDADGETGLSWTSAGSIYQAEGMVRTVVRRIQINRVTLCGLPEIEENEG